MNLEKVVFGFFVLLAATLNFGFVLGDMSDPAQHNVYELFAALVVSLVATVLKFGDRTQMGAVHLATSLVADLQLVAAATVWGFVANASPAGLDAAGTTAVVSLAAGALLANSVSVVLLVAETVTLSRPSAETAMTDPSRMPPSATIFLVMRRMRVPLITLIMIFAIGVLGLTLVPGQDELGAPYRMGFLDAFYFMSYTASTIGFGELPYPFTYAQRLWVTATIFLTVVGWAYAIGSLLALLRDRGFRQAVRTAHFTRKVARLREPFLLIAGYGDTGELLGRAFDRLGRRFVVLDLDRERIEGLDLAPYRADVPGLVGDARDAGRLTVAGLEHPWCAGVLALTTTRRT